YRLATHRAPQPLGSHQSLDRAAGDLDALALQLPPHLARSIHLQIRLPDPLNVVRQHLVATNPRTAQGRIAAASHGTSISGRSDLQYLADRLDPEALAVRVDETVHHLLRRSSSACAKYALARRRISLAFFSSRTSRSNSLTRAAS